MVKKYIESLKERADEVFSKTLKNLPNKFGYTKHDGNRIIECSIDFYSLGFNFWLSDFTKIVPSRPIIGDALFNASNLAENSVFQVTCGFYRDACAKLREILDDFLNSLYFDIIHEKKIDIGYKYVEWRIGETDKFPFLKNDVLKTIFREGFFLKYDKKFGLKNELIEFYRELSKYTHIRPKKYKGGLTSKSSLLNLQFNSKDYDVFSNYLKKTYMIISTLIVLRFPQFRELNTKELGRFKRLDPTLFKNIEGVINSLI